MFPFDLLTLKAPFIMPHLVIRSTVRSDPLGKTADLLRACR